MTDLALPIPDELVEAIATRAAEIVLERLRPAEPREWLTLDEAAKRLGCSRDAVRMRGKRGRLETRHQGRRVYVSRKSVDELQ
jgi:excisionase family DNA binding protein